MTNPSKTIFMAEQDAFYQVGNPKKGKASEKHYHGVFEIYYLEKGSCTYFIDDKCYQVEEGDIVLIPPEIIHGTVYPSEKNRRKLIYCSEKYIPKSVLPEIPSLLYVYRNPHISEQIEELFKKIENECTVNDVFSSEMTPLLLGEFFVMLARNVKGRMDIGSGSICVEKAIRYMKKNYHMSIGLSDVAEVCHMSAEHFSRKFKKETGLGFNEYLNILRLQQAVLLLRTSPDVSVSRVAFECGFNDSNYFSKKFRQEYGYTPQMIKKGADRTNVPSDRSVKSADKT